MKLYLAGPEVFLEDAREIGARKKALCAAHGFTGLFPLDPAIPDGSDQRAGAAIFAANLGLMRQADAILANLTPFRGIGADAGTAFELGFCHGLGKPVAAYSAVPGELKHRALAAIGAAGPQADTGAGSAPILLADGFQVEDFGHFDNLMLAEAVLAGGLAVVTARTAAADPLRDLATFEEALAALAQARDRGALAITGGEPARPRPLHVNQPAEAGAARYSAEESSHG